MCLNGRWSGFASATKRLATSMTDPGRAFHARQLLEMTACWSASQLQGEWTPVSSRTIRRILPHNGLHGRIAAQKLALNKRRLRNRWTAEKIFFQMNRQLPPSTLPTTRGIRFFNRMEQPCLTSGSTMKFLRGKKIKVLQGWPAQSPDINIIEHIWGRMKEEAWRTKPKNFGMPARWPSMPSLITLSTNSMTLPNRMATVLQAKGTHTRY